MRGTLEDLDIDALAKENVRGGKAANACVRVHICMSVWGGGLVYLCVVYIPAPTIITSLKGVGAVILSGGM